MAADRPTRIAFVDTGNTGRSVTAEALAAAVIAKAHINAQVISRAVDLNPYNIHPEENFVTLLRERGLDIAPHLAAQFGSQEAKYSDVILVMTDTHKAWVVAHFPRGQGQSLQLGRIRDRQRTRRFWTRSASPWRSTRPCWRSSIRSWRRRSRRRRPSPDDMGRLDFTRNHRWIGLW